MAIKSLMNGHFFYNSGEQIETPMRGKKVADMKYELLLKTKMVTKATGQDH